MKKKQIDLWVEGFRVVEAEAKASYLGTYQAKTLKEAVIQWLNENPKEKKYVDLDNLTHWGCSFYDNEYDARKTFG